MRQGYFEDCLKKIQYNRTDGELSAVQAKALQLEVANKIEQKRRLDQDFAVGRIKPKLYNEWDANIRSDIARISERVDDMVRAHRKAKKTKKRLAILGVVALAVAIGAVIMVPQYFHARRTIAGIPEPVQVDIDELVGEAGARGEVFETEKTISGDGYIAKMKYLASYDIKGLVVELDDYDKIGAQAFDKAIPRDVSLAWGASAEHSDVIKWSHGNRKLKREYNPNDLVKYSVMRHDITDTSSNNHILVDDKELYRKLKRVRIGDYIEMKGYLVEATITDEYGNGAYTVRSSLVRTDFSTSALDTKTSCEVIYITSIEWLD